MFGRWLPPPAARPSRRAGRPKPRHAKVGAAMPAELSQHALAGGVKRNKERNVNQSGDTRFGLGQLLRARIRPMAGDSPSGYSLTGQSGLVFDVGAPHRRVHRSESPDQHASPPPYRRSPPRPLGAWRQPPPSSRAPWLLFALRKPVTRRTRCLQSATARRRCAALQSRAQ